MSACRFDKIVGWVLHSYYRNSLFDGSSVTISKAENGENICSCMYICVLLFIVGVITSIVKKKIFFSILIYTDRQWNLKNYYNGI